MKQILKLVESAIRLNYYYGNPYPSSIDYPLEEKLEVKRLSVVPIRNAQDIHHALTNRETLDKILARIRRRESKVQ